jgi:hypothetical protein
MPTAMVSAMNLITEMFSRRRFLAIMPGLEARTRWMKKPIATPIRIERKGTSMVRPLPRGGR